MSYMYAVYLDHIHPSPPSPANPQNSHTFPSQLYTLLVLIDWFYFFNPLNPISAASLHIGMVLKQILRVKGLFRFLSVVKHTESREKKSIIFCSYYFSHMMINTCPVFFHLCHPLSILTSPSQPPVYLKANLPVISLGWLYHSVVDPCLVGSCLFILFY